MFFNICFSYQYHKYYMTIAYQRGKIRLCVLKTLHWNRKHSMDETAYFDNAIFYVRIIIIKLATFVIVAPRHSA
jgi:hypothetical protein